MASPLRTRNYFLTSRRFVSGAVLRSRRLGFLVWPAAWLELGRELSLEVRVSRLTMGWGGWRVQADLGTFDPIPTTGPVDWERMGVDGYLAWARKTFGRKWGRMDIERLFRDDPAWRHLAMLGTAHNHYVRVVLARAMLSIQDSPALGRNEGLSAATTPGGQENSPASGDTGPESGSFLEDLDRLGASLTRNQDASEVDSGSRPN